MDKADADGPPTTYSGIDSVGLVILDDPQNLAPGVARILQAAAGRIADTRRRGDRMYSSRRSWPFAMVRSDRIPPDGAGRPGSLATTISTGPLMRPALRIQTYAVHEASLMQCDMVRYLRGVERILEGGDGTPSDRDLRAIAVASKLCDRDPRHDGDLVVLHSGTAFEPPFLYDESYRGDRRMDPRILPMARHLSAMVDALPHVTRATLGRDDKGVPWVSITPCANQADNNLSQDDLDLVGWPSQAA